MLTTDWLVREGASKKLSLLGEIFRTSRLKRLNSKYNLDLQKYRPWMCKEEVSEKFLSLFDPNSLTPTLAPFVDLKYVEAMSQFYIADYFPFMEKMPCDIGSSDYEETGRLIVKNALARLRASNSWVADVFDNVVAEVFPISKKGQYYNGMGGISSPHLLGLMFIGPVEPPHSEIKLVLAIAHETAHQALMTIQLSENITNGNVELKTYSPIRRKMRPIVASIHACAALAYMLDTARALLTSCSDDEAVFLNEFISDSKPHLKQSLLELNRVDLSRIGKKVILEIESVLDSVTTHEA